MPSDEAALPCGTPRLRSSWARPRRAPSEHGPVAVADDATVRAPTVESSVPEILAVLAASWGVLMALSPILQIRRILERRSSADVSIGYLGVLLVGFALWAGYGLSIANAALIVPNGVALVVGLATVLVAWRYRTPAGTADSAVDD